MAGSDSIQQPLSTNLRYGYSSDVVLDEVSLYSSMRFPADVLFPQHTLFEVRSERFRPSLKIPLVPTISKPISIFSFFAGTGFLDLGFEFSGFRVAYVNELHSSFLDAYRYARKHLNLEQPEYGYHQGNISDFVEHEKNVLLKELVQEARKKSDIVGFIGGPPCPDFSVGGKNKGREGDHGKLSATYVELICQQKPDFFLFENVKGLWSTKRHREFFEEIKQKTHLTGYVTTERLVNSIEYGVPQDRDRVILLGFRRDLLIDMGIKLDKTSYVVPKEVFPWEKLVKYHKEEAFTFPWPTTHPFEEDSDMACADAIIEDLTVEHWFKKNDVLKHPNAEHYFKPRAGIARFASVKEGDDSRKSFKRLHRWRYSPTACYGNNEVHLHPYKIRRISAAEAMAIQSLPKDFVLPPSMTLTDMFKTIGNGVPYVMARTLAQTISSFFGEI